MPVAVDIEDPTSLVAYLRDTGRITPDENPAVQP